MIQWKTKTEIQLSKFYGENEEKKSTKFVWYQ